VFTIRLRLGLAAAALAVASATFADPVISAHPRLLLSASEKARLIARKDANDPAWQRLKSRADTLATYSILQFKFAERNNAPNGTIYYTYQGEGWYDATFPLAFAYQMTGDTRY